MTVPYCSKDQWAKRKARVDWITYAANNKYPDEGALDDVLEDATETMNDLEHIGSEDINITTTKSLPRLERICYNVANRTLMIEKNQGSNPGSWTFSPQDNMYDKERRLLWNIGTAEGYRVRGGSV